MLIVNSNRSPNYSLYYIGAKILEVLSNRNALFVDDVFCAIKQQYSNGLSIDYFYLSMDWLFLINSIEIKEGMVYAI